MSDLTLSDLQASVKDTRAFRTLEDYYRLTIAFRDYLDEQPPTRIISPTMTNYVFYQYRGEGAPKITRPLNTDLFYEASVTFEAAYTRFGAFLDDLKEHQLALLDRESVQAYLASNEVNRVVYTIQQSIGCIGDSFADSNQSRKRVGQLFETLVALLIRQLGLQCESRTIRLPVPGFPDYRMEYELDLVFSRNQAIVTSETVYLHPQEIVGSVKTTSKDRIDKVFLDKYLLTKLLGRDVPVIAVFLHDVQRATKAGSIFGVNSTFKSGHFLGYTVALTKLDGVYFVDPRPEMTTNPRLRNQIHDLQRLLVRDLWLLTEPTDRA